MISFEEAYKIVLDSYMEFGTETVSLSDSHHRILAEAIYADRDFPPFDRVTKDGIAINFADYQNGVRAFEIQEVAAAGEAQKELKGSKSCIEVMTGAIVPKGTDTVIMYEHVTIKDSTAHLQKEIAKGQNIHYQGSDEPKGNLLLKKGTRITAAEIGVLASVGKATVSVKKMPKVAIISTGDELVDVEKTPKLHQIRKSNALSIAAALKVEGIESKKLHFNDLEEELMVGLQRALEDFDVLLLSGGVSKGKFDFLPQVLEDLGVTKLFHRVKQRPGKPFWFGKHIGMDCTIFAFPGNPGSTFANYHVYFLPWLLKSLGIPVDNHHVILNELFENKTGLTRFIRASSHLVDAQIKANLVMGNGSGDLTSLSQSNGFILLEPERAYEVGELVPFFPTKRLV
ncbi:molybdopterin molybdotransferase MoeA [Allomuricauda sp. d1]|uniref:molybdopterin molybdotransferase MoeA n=1 Tax=Allomuricauda sp. d1 TaxID=3136725 RepID=UPI0031DFBB30